MFQYNFTPYRLIFSSTPFYLAVGKPVINVFIKYIAETEVLTFDEDLTLDKEDLINGEVIILCLGRNHCRSLSLFCLIIIK